jgi:hypothetical protein
MSHHFVLCWFGFGFGLWPIPLPFELTLSLLGQFVEGRSSFDVPFGTHLEIVTPATGIGSSFT